MNSQFESCRVFIPKIQWISYKFADFSQPDATDISVHQVGFVGISDGTSPFNEFLYQQPAYADTSIWRSAMPLTDVKVWSAKPEDKAYKLTDGEGMHLMVHPNGSKYWRLQYRFDGKQKTLALGVYPEITLSEARQRRDEAKHI